MTIDTSREAVELRQTRLRAAYEEFRAPYGHIAALITQAKLTETMMDALLARAEAAEAREQTLLMKQTDLINDTVLMGMARDEAIAERDAALAEVARLSTPPDDAETAGLVGALGVKSAMIKMCEKIAWGSDTALMDKAADFITRLSHALAAETAKREAMEVALSREPSLIWIIENTSQVRIRDLALDMLEQQRATLAKHGSKT